MGNCCETGASETEVKMQMPKPEAENRSIDE